MFENWVFHDVNPVFLQLESKLKCSILSGKLSAGTELPSIRRAAEMLNISSNTVSKAYSYMCREGLVQHTKHGRFTVIYDRVLIKKARTGAAKSLCYAYYFGMNDLGYTKQESDIIIQKFIKEFPDKTAETIQTIKHKLKQGAIVNSIAPCVC